jgi:predicted membrane-bound dolichyl-phosphate-mannose-protein mannosyltransferase
VLALLVTPAVVYFATYIPWFLHFGWDLQRWAEMQGSAARFHADLKAVNDQGQPWHAYFAPAWKWILLARPTYYYGAFGSEGVRQVIYAQGNPAIFWCSLLAIPYVATHGGARALASEVRDRDDRRTLSPGS